MDSEIKKINETITDIAFSSLLVMIVLAVFGVIAWKWVLIPLPLALVISILIGTMGRIYARHRGSKTK